MAEETTSVKICNHEGNELVYDNVKSIILKKEDGAFVRFDYVGTFNPDTEITT